MKDMMPWSKEDSDDIPGVEMTEENMIHEKNFEAVEDRKVAIGSKKMLKSNEQDPSRVVIIKHDKKVRK